LDERHATIAVKKNNQVFQLLSAWLFSWGINGSQWKLESFAANCEEFQTRTSHPALQLLQSLAQSLQPLQLSD
jgi:hypothetical protein